MDVSVIRSCIFPITLPISKNTNKPSAEVQDNHLRIEGEEEPRQTLIQTIISCVLELVKSETVLL